MRTPPTGSRARAKPVVPTPSGRASGRPAPAGAGRRRDPADSFGKGDGGGPASEQGLKPLRRLTARVVVVEGEEDAGAAPEGRGDPLHALGAQGCGSRKAPSGKGEPVEDPLGDDRPRRRRAETPHPKHRLGAGQSLEPGRPVGIDGPADEPADETAGGVGDDDHASEPLRSPLHEQPAVPEPVGREAVRLKGLSQPAARRIAEAQAGCRGRADAPRGQVLPPFGMTAQPSGVEPSRRRQQGGVSRRQRGVPSPPRSGWTNSGPGRKPWAAVQPRDGLRQAQVLDAPDEVQHVSPFATAEAVEPLRVAVHREAALGLVVEGPDALADPAPSAQPHPRRLHRVAQRVTRLQRGDVHVGRDHHAPPFSGLSPRRLRREMSLPGSQRSPRTAATSSEPSPLGTSAAARPVPWL